MALVKAIESGDTDLGITLLSDGLIFSLHCVTASPEKTPFGSVLQSHQ